METVRKMEVLEEGIKDNSQWYPCCFAQFTFIM